MSTETPKLSYHCVSVVAGLQGCLEAQALREVRILSADAPRLPLPNCDKPDTCQCIYRHYDDRRVGPRRSHDRGGLADPWAYTERRRQGGRRATD